MLTLSKSSTIEDIYSLLQEIDSALTIHNQFFVKSIVRVAHVSLAMSQYGVDFEKDHLDLQADLMVAALKKSKDAPIDLETFTDLALQTTMRKT